jgi:hypothetical protein
MYIYICRDMHIHVKRTKNIILLNNHQYLSTILVSLKEKTCHGETESPSAHTAPINVTTRTPATVKCATTPTVVEQGESPLDNQATTKAPLGSLAEQGEAPLAKQATTKAKTTAGAAETAHTASMNVTSGATATRNIPVIVTSHLVKCGTTPSTVAEHGEATAGAAALADMSLGITSTCRPPLSTGKPS